MGETSTITVSSPNHHQELANGLWKLFQSKQGLDLEIRCVGRSIRAHWLLLQAFMLTDNSDHFSPIHKGDSEGTVHHQEEPNDNLLESLLEFLYKGTVTLSGELLDDLLTAARELDFRILVDAVESAKQDKKTNKRPQRRGRPVKVSKMEDKTEKTTETLAKRPTRAKASRTTCREVLPAKIQPSSNDDGGQSDTSGSSDWKPDADATTTTITTGKRKVATGGRPKVASGKPKRLKKAGKRQQNSEQAAKKKSGWPGYQATALKCDHCDFTTASKSVLAIHVASKHDPSIAIFRCTVCWRKFLSEDGLQSHHRSAHPEEFSCPHCDFKSRKKIPFQLHVAKHDPDQAVLHPCDLCRRLFKTFDALEEHKANHKVYKCKLCDFESKKMNGLSHHRFLVHSVDAKGNPLPTFDCSECKFKTTKRSVLEYHILAMHSGLKPYQCPYCEYVTARKPEVNRHIKVSHLNVKPHVCEICDYRTVSRSALENHINSHTGIKPYKCEFCESVFANRSSLTEHTRSHTGETKSYICHKCGRAFNRPYHLTVHLRNVHRNDKD